MMVRLAAVVAAVVVVVFVLDFLGPVVSGRQCDGTIPTWMIEAQDYDGGGCADVLPFWQRPLFADDTPYCLGLCADPLSMGSR